MYYEDILLLWNKAIILFDICFWQIDWFLAEKFPRISQNLDESFFRSLMFVKNSFKV